MRTLVPALLFLILAPSARAVDGLREISQACVATGCFEGDAPGLPITIDRGQPGSYLLTSNVTTDDPDQTIIRILDSNVTLDLGGFAISGPSVCSGVPLTCTVSGSGTGIDGGTVVDASGVTVRNGIIRGMGRSGVVLGRSAHVEEVLVVSNAQNGIAVGANSLVMNCRVERNGSFGILTLGLESPGARVVGNVVSGNRDFGIDTESLAGGAIVLDNTVTGHGSVGATLSAGDGYARNVFRGNGTDVVGGIQIGTNLCGSNTTCP